LEVIAAEMAAVADLGVGTESDPVLMGGWSEGIVLAGGLVVDATAGDFPFLSPFEGKSLGAATAVDTRVD
jgi:hypothetical protein